jgi:ParB family chromosome partitioning protein
VIHEDIETNKRLALQLIENLHREDLNAIDKARALIAFKDIVGSWEEADRLTGLSVRRRQQFTAILKLPEEIQSEIVAIGRDPQNINFTFLKKIQKNKTSCLSAW